MAQSGWTLVYDNPDVLPRVPALSCSDGMNCTAVGSSYSVDFYPSIVRTTDGGFSWSRQEHGLPFIEYTANGGNGLTVQLYDVDMVDSATAFVVGAQGAMLRTTDAGATWLRSDSITSQPLTWVSFADRMTGIAASNVKTHNVIYVTRDGGVNWSAETNGLQGFDKLIAITPWKLLAMTVDNQAHYLYSTNGGTIWSSSRFPIQSSLQRSWHPYFSFVDTLHGFAAGVIANGAGTQDAVFSTRNGGADWTLVYAQPQIGGGMIAIRFTDTLNGEAVTKTGTIYRTIDGGKSWERTVLAPSDILGAQTFTAVSFAGPKIIAITGGGKLLTYGTEVAAVPMEHRISPSLSIYPNPASTSVTLEVPERMRGAGELTVTFFDQLGGEARRVGALAGDGRISLSVGDLPRGVYRARIAGAGDIVWGGFVLR